MTGRIFKLALALALNVFELPKVNYFEYYQQLINFPEQKTFSCLTFFSIKLTSSQAANMPQDRHIPKKKMRRTSLLVVSTSIEKVCRWGEFFSFPVPRILLANDLFMIFILFLQVFQNKFSSSCCCCFSCCSRAHDEYLLKLPKLLLLQIELCCQLGMLVLFSLSPSVIVLCLFFLANCYKFYTWANAMLSNPNYHI